MAWLTFLNCAMADLYIDVGKNIVVSSKPVMQIHNKIYI
jgi:hypothetical protein